MSSISSRAANSLENKKKYNGIDWENDLDLAVYDAFFRELDPQIGRWWQVDPKTEDMEQWSPYASNYDNPITYSDPLGDEPDGDGPGDPPSTATRIWGAVKAVGGLAEMVVGAVGGAATSWTGVGAVVGGAAVVHGADNFAAGLTQLFSGNSKQTFTEQGISKGLQATGFSPQTANTVAGYTDAGVSIALTAGAGAAANGSKVGKVSKSASTTNSQGLGNPFKNSTLKEVRNNFEKRASQGKMEKKGPNAYINKKSGYSYNVDKGGNYGRGGKKVEKPHVDVNYPNPKPKNVPPKKKLNVAGE
jgi:RHS repeat-associated protein